MELTPISRKYVDVLITGTNADNTPAVISSALVALIDQGVEPHASVSWTPVTVTAGVARVLLIGPEADPVNGGLVVPATMDLWMKVDNAPEVLPVKVGTVRVSS